MLQQLELKFGFRGRGTFKISNKIPDIAKKAGRLRPQSVVRRKLADISNLPQNQRLLIQGEKSQSIETTTKEYINQLQKELNSGKDRLKVLQHELGCKSGLLKARKLELEEKVRTRTCKNADAELIKFREEGESSKEGKDDETPQNTKRSLQSNSLGSSEHVHSYGED